MFIANFGAEVGYAWKTIDVVYRRVGSELRRAGVQTFMCYPTAGPDDAPHGGAASIAFDYDRTRSGPRGMLAFLRLLRRHRIGILYFTDRTRFSWRYPLYRLAGVRCIVVHDRTSGERTVRFGVSRVLKAALHYLPGITADQYIAVSEYVARRLIEVGAPQARVRRIYNGIEIARFSRQPDFALHDLLGLPRRTRIVFAAGRAQPYKGIEVLIESAAALDARGFREVAFVFCGDGPMLAELGALAKARGLGAFYFLGRREDVPRLLSSATIAVVPSVWAEAFGLTVVEAMAARVPVIATAVGGIPELIDHGRTGLLVPPRDSEALAEALTQLLEAPALRSRLAREAREDVEQRFTIDRTVSELVAFLKDLMHLPQDLTIPPAARPRAGSARPEVIRTHRGSSAPEH